MCEANVDAPSDVAKPSTNSHMTAGSMAIADERVSIERHGVEMTSRPRDVPRGSSHVPATELPLDLLSFTRLLRARPDERALTHTSRNWLGVSDETECDHARIEMAGRFE